MKFRLANPVEAVSGAAAFYSTPIQIGGMGGDSYSVQAVIDVDTPSAKTFDSGVAAFLAVQDLTYTADLRGTAGNSITIAYTGGGTAGAEVVTVVGTAISVQIQSGVSTGTQVKTAVDASVAASALISVAVTGTGSNAQVTAAVTPLAGGIASEVDIVANTVTIPSHGYTLGLKGQLTTTGTLPAGLSLATDYFIIVVDANTVKFASSLANAQAGTAVDITNQGASASVNTFTATSIAGATIGLQQSNNYDPITLAGDWAALGSTTSITVDAVVALEKDRPTFNWIRVAFALTAGHISATLYQLVKGDLE